MRSADISQGEPWTSRRDPMPHLGHYFFICCSYERRNITIDKMACASGIIVSHKPITLRARRGPWRPPNQASRQASKPLITKSSSGSMLVLFGRNSRPPWQVAAADWFAPGEARFEFLGSNLEGMDQPCRNQVAPQETELLRTRNAMLRPATESIALNSGL